MCCSGQPRVDGVDQLAVERAGRGVRQIDDHGRLQTRPSRAIISVADSGPGVPEHLREAIFARGVTSKPDVPGGRGIGLALVRLVSAQLGGTVDVSDGPHGGAVFDVRLPLDRPDGSSGNA